MGNFNITRTGFPIGREPQIINFGKSRTIASHAKGLTVNEIMKRFSSTGTIPTRLVPGEFLDTTVLPNMFDALNMRVKLNAYFDGLDSTTRAKFENDPMKLVSFINEPKNVDKSLEMGLLKLTPEGVKAKQAFDVAQLKKKEADRQAFVADISQIVKSQGGIPDVKV